MESVIDLSKSNIPWNKGKIVGQKTALKLKEIWGIRIRLQLENNIREPALFNMVTNRTQHITNFLRLQVHLKELVRYF